MTGHVQEVERAKGREALRDSQPPWATTYTGTTLVSGIWVPCCHITAFCTKAAEINVPLRSTSLPLRSKCWQKTNHSSSLIKMSQEETGNHRGRHRPCSCSRDRNQSGSQGRPGCPPPHVRVYGRGEAPGVTERCLGNQRTMLPLRTLKNHLFHFSQERLAGCTCQNHEPPGVFWESPIQYGWGRTRKSEFLTISYDRAKG